jgi:hypothetical protein
VGLRTVLCVAMPMRCSPRWEPAFGLTRQQGIVSHGDKIRRKVGLGYADLGGLQAKLKCRDCWARPSGTDSTALVAFPAHRIVGPLALWAARHQNAAAI